MKQFFKIWQRRIANGAKLVSNDLGAVSLGAAVVFFTRAFPSVYLNDFNFWMLAASIALCITGLSLRLYYRHTNEN